MDSIQSQSPEHSSRGMTKLVASAPQAVRPAAKSWDSHRWVTPCGLIAGPFDRGSIVGTNTVCMCVGFGPWVGDRDNIHNSVTQKGSSLALSIRHSVCMGSLARLCTLQDSTLGLIGRALASVSHCTHSTEHDKALPQ